jgi:hypothetical protein
MARPARKFSGYETSYETRSAVASDRPDVEGRDPALLAPPEVQWASGINFLLGVWLVIAPWVLGYSGQDNAVWNQVGVGAAIAIVAMARVSAPDTWAPLSWMNVVLGGWLVVAPFVLQYNATSNTEPIYWNDIIVGAAVLILALISTAGARRGGTTARI